MISTNPGRAPGWRAKRFTLVIGVPSSFMLLLLGSVSWKIAGGDPARSTAVVAQMQMLIAIFGAGTGLAVALSTIYYAVRNGEMVNTMAEAAVEDRPRVRSSAVERLVDAAIDFGLHSGTLATLMEGAKRWQLPGKARGRDTLIAQSFAVVTARLGEVLKAGEALRSLDPATDDLVVELGMTVEQVWTASVEGRSDAVYEAVGQMRVLLEQLRAA